MRDKITKQKLKTFKTAHAMIEMNADGKLVKIIKGDRGLLERLTIISISRPQLALKECIGNY